MLREGFFYRVNKLCVSVSSVRFLFLQEVYGGGLMGYFGVKKTEDVLFIYFYWFRMRRDVERYVFRCITCNKVKFRFNFYGFYLFFSVFRVFWEDIFMDFVLGLFSMKSGSDSVFVIVDRFLKMVYFMFCYKTDNVLYIVDLFFTEIVRLYGVLNIIVSDSDVKFLSYFWSILWFKLGMKLLFFIICYF